MISFRRWPAYGIFTVNLCFVLRAFSYPYAHPAVEAAEHNW